MHNNRLNLLPESRTHVHMRAYVIRLAVVTLTGIIGITFVTGILLTPTQLLLTNSLKIKQERLSKIESQVSSDPALVRRSAALSGHVALLTERSQSASASYVLREALAVPRQGIRLLNLNFVRGGGEKADIVVLSGIATTRDTLRNYLLALQGSELASSATLPVSSYAKDADVPFAITVTLAP